MSEIKNFVDFSGEFTSIGVKLPKYQRSTDQQPVWLHFGGGNLYRGFHGKIAQDLLDQGDLPAGIIVGETFDEEVIEKIYQAFDNNLLQVVMHEDGSLEKNLLNSTTASFFVQPGEKSYQEFEEYFINEALQLVTLTITEKGYNIWTTEEEFLPIIKNDLALGPSGARHTMAIITGLLLARFMAGAQPLAMVSTDNFSKNGEKFQQAVVTIADQWVENKFAPPEFIEYLTNDKKISFPWTMIDRITPNPSVKVAKRLQALGIEDAEILQTRKHTNIASFANTEEVHYLVLEDSFPNGRPALEQAGVILTDQMTVEQADAMKVTTTLNPLHTALAVFGPLLGYSSIADEMKNPDLVALIKGIGYREGLPVVVDPKIINPQEFIDQVVQKRLPNEMIPDSPQRIVTDTSLKLAVRYGETIGKYMERPDLAAENLRFIPLTIAGWLRYLLGVDDDGKNFALSPDPLLAELTSQLEVLGFGANLTEVHSSVQKILSNKKIFGVDLYEAGLGEHIENHLVELLAGQGAVKHTLHKFIKENGEA